MYYLISNLLTSPLFWLANILFLIGYTWVAKVDNVDTVLATHVNDLQDKKCDDMDNITTKTDSYSLTAADMKKDAIFIMNSAGDKIFTLPSVGVGDVGIGCVLVKTGVGKLTIQASDVDTINDSSASGTLYNDVAGETWAAVMIKLITTTQWIAFPLGSGWITT